MRPHILLGLALAVILTATAAAQPPIAPPPPHEPVALPAGSLYRNDTISKVLNLTPLQLERLNKVSDPILSKFADDVNKLGPALTAGERAARVAQLQQLAANEWNRSARDVFNEQQYARYQQLQWQHGGFNTLTDPDLQRRFNLSDAQRRQLEESIVWSRDQLAEIRRLPPAERDRALRQYRDYRAAYQERFGRFLTPEQLRTWREMTGDPFFCPPPCPPAERPRP
jgi:hypothetical protein